MFSKLITTIKTRHQGEKGITDLETAIILIAFVTVAAVFGYAVLSAGIFSAEKGKEAVYLGLEEAESTMELTGGVILIGDNTTQAVTTISFTVRNTVGGEPIDLTEPGPGHNNKCILAYIDPGQYHNDVVWSLDWIGYDDGDGLLEIGEKAEITFDCTNIDGAGAPLNPILGINTKFTLEFKPPTGAVVTSERVTPAYIDSAMNLH